MNGLLTTSQAAKLLGISTRTLFTLTKDGRLPSIKLAGVKYDPADIQAFIDSCRNRKTEGEPST